MLDFVQCQSILKHYWCADVFVSQAYSSPISKCSYAHKNCMYPGNWLHVHNFHKKSGKSDFTYYKRKQNYLNFDERLSRSSVNK